MLHSPSFQATRIALVLLLSGVAAFAQTSPATKQVPPEGLKLAPTEHTRLLNIATELEKDIRRAETDLASAPASLALLPDIEIFSKAVHNAVTYNEIFNRKQVATAEMLIAEGRRRLEMLREGKPRWTGQNGLVVRGYRSRIDGSVQPYGLVVPESWSAGDRRERRLDLWHHGRNEKLTELAFLEDRMTHPGEFTPRDTFVLHPYGRFCNATKFAGETDVFEAMEHVRANYPIDSKRIVVRGFSMGGASAWHLAAHHAGLWAAAAPGAGFAETPVYTKAFAPQKEPPPWWEQVLWRLYDATAYAANLANTEVVAYSGEEDSQRQAAEIMGDAMKTAGLNLVHLIGPKTGHKYEPETKEELSRHIDELAEKGREDVPARVHLTTYTLRYPRQEWVEVTGLEKHWELTEVRAQLADEGTIRLETKNVTSLTLDIQADPVPLDPTRPPRVLIDGQELVGSKVASPWIAHFTKIDGQWQTSETSGKEHAGLRKRHGLQGPIDDAFMDSFVFVKPTGKAHHESVDGWVKTEMERAVPQWRRVFRGDARVAEDTAVDDALIANANLVLWGDPASNAVLARILPQLPIQWTPEYLQVGQTRYAADAHVPVLIFPNPLNPKRYVVLNSSFTFREGSAISNALQTPMLPDWAVIDLRTAPTPTAPGLVVNAGFFDEQWRFPTDL